MIAILPRGICINNSIAVYICSHVENCYIYTTMRHKCVKYICVTILFPQKTVNSSPSNANVDYTSHYSHHIPNYVGMTSSGYTRDDATLSLCPSHSIVALNQDVNSPSHPLPPFCTIPPFMEMQVPPHRLNLPPAANYPWYPLSPEPLPGPHGFPHSVPGPDGLSHYTHFPISCQSTPYVDSWPLPSYSAPLHAHK